MGCDVPTAQKFADAYNNGFKGIARYKKEGAKFVRENGYILLNPITGHKTYWWDWKEWMKTQEFFTSEFWDTYRQYHKGTGDYVAQTVSKHFKSVSKWERKALNSVTQGTGAIILKASQVKVFHWVVKNGYFGKILLNNLTHDESNWEFPKSLLAEFPDVLKNTMEETAGEYCKSLPIPASIEISDHWVH